MLHTNNNKYIYTYILYLFNIFHVCAVRSIITFGDTRGRAKYNSAIVWKNIDLFCFYTISECVQNIYVAATVHVTKGKTTKQTILLLEN